MAMTTNTLSTSTPQRESAQGGTDPHLAWMRRAAELRARINAGTLDEARKDALGEELDHLHDQIAATRPETHEGAIAQLELALSYLGDPDGWIPAEECQGRALQNVIGWLKAQAAEEDARDVALEEMLAELRSLQAVCRKALIAYDRILQRRR